MRDSVSSGGAFPAARIFGHHDAHPVALSSLLVKRFGGDWIEWEPETLWEEISKEFTPLFRSKFGARFFVTVSSLTKNKIQAVRTLLLTNGFWDAWEIFSPVTQALNNNIPTFHLLQKPSVAQLFNAVTIAKMIKSDQEYSEEVGRYVAACALDEGVWVLPEPLYFAQLYAAQPQYECLDCGNIDELDIPKTDARCDACTCRFSTDHDAHALNWKPARGIPEEAGKNLKLSLKHDPTAAQARWDQIKGMPADEVELDEEQDDIVCAKLLVARDYMGLRKRQLRHQLEALAAL